MARKVHSRVNIWGETEYYDEFQTYLGKKSRSFFGGDVFQDAFGRTSKDSFWEKEEEELDNEVWDDSDFADEDDRYDLFDEDSDDWE